MNKVFNSFSILFLTLFSCKTDNVSSISADDYEKASFHMSRSLNKHLNNVLTYQKWDDEDIFHYGVRFKDKTDSFTINLKSLEKTDYNHTAKIDTKKNVQVVKKNRNEFLSPNGKLAAYIEDFNLWIRNTKTGKRIQLTFEGEKDYGYATNNAG